MDFYNDAPTTTARLIVSPVGWRVKLSRQFSLRVALDQLQQFRKHLFIVFHK
jgi:hypothetical protein